jgi:hypothetical protein
MVNRIEFCHQRVSQGVTVFSSICFSDESRIVLHDGEEWVWERKEENNPSANVETEKIPKVVMVFAAIAIGSESQLLFIKGNRRRAIHPQYRGFNWIFQQDGACCQTAGHVVDWPEEPCDVIADWSANSPDLNPIELL